MNVHEDQYQQHPVFGQLSKCSEFYGQLAQSVFRCVNGGTGSAWNIDSYVFSSIQGTLESISALLRNGRINDGYALLRKYHDSAVINIYSLLYLDEHFGIDNFVVEQINSWVRGKASLPEYRVMVQYIRASAQVVAITRVLNADTRYKQLRNRCNDHSHYNFYQNVLLNDNGIHLPRRARALDELSTDLRDLFILHFAYLFSARQHYMMSSDYTDHLDCGMQPEPDSQYWVAPFIQKVFDDTIKVHRPDVAAELKAHTSMHLL